MEGGLGLHLQSAVRWKDENGHRTGTSWKERKMRRRRKRDETRERVVKHRGRRVRSDRLRDGCGTQIE